MKSSKNKILFFVESLDGGGAEGALAANVANLNHDKWDITVVSETDGEMRIPFIKQYSKYHPFIHKNLNHNPVRELINRIILTGSVRLPPSTVRSLYLRGKYDVEVAGCEGYATKIISSSKCKTSVKIAYVHTDFSNNHWSVGEFASEEEERQCYERLDYIVCVSESIREAFVKTYGMREKTVVIYNIVEDDKIKRLGLEQPSIPVNEMKKPFFVLAGSFVKVKGYDRFVRAASRLKSEDYSFSAAIMGIGYHRKEIEELIVQTDTEDVIKLYEYQKNPYAIFNSADAFVCSSHAEGYSTVATESVILGVPVITTDCSGMAEIFGGTECGIICENSEDGLYGALKKVLDEPSLLLKYRKNAEKRSEFFSKESRIQAVNEFFSKCVE